MPCCMCRPSNLAVSAEPEVISMPDTTTSDSEDRSEYPASDAESMEGVGQCYPEQPLTGRQEPPFNVMLTCYTLFERDSVEQQADRSFLKKWQWSHLLLDEAHAVKNANAMRTKRLTRYISNIIRHTSETFSNKHVASLCVCALLLQCSCGMTDMHSSHLSRRLLMTLHERCHSMLNCSIGV